MEIIDKFIWDAWKSSSRDTLENVLHQLPKKTIIENAKSHVQNLTGTKAEIIQKILDAIFSGENESENHS